MDADVTSQGLVLSGLEPTTEYVVEVLISNGLYDEIMRFTITTNLGREAIAIGEWDVGGIRDRKGVGWDGWYTVLWSWWWY